MNMLSELNKACRSYVKKGSKRNRQLVVKRMKKFILFAQSRHARNWGQIGPRTFKAFCKDNELAESTQRQYIVAIKKLEQLVGHKIRILKEINHETHSDD